MESSPETLWIVRMIVLRCGVCTGILLVQHIEGVGSNGAASASSLGLSGVRLIFGWVELCYTSNQWWWNYTSESSSSSVASVKFEGVVARGRVWVLVLYPCGSHQATTRNGVWIGSKQWFKNWELWKGMAERVSFLMCLYAWQVKFKVSFGWRWG